MAQVTVRQKQLGQVIDTLGAQERFGDELNGVALAAIEQQIIFPTRGIAIDRRTASGGQDRQARERRCRPLLPAPDNYQETKSANLPRA